MQLRTDTIAALSTPPGRGALAVLRLSGHLAHSIAQRLCARWPNRARECVLTDLSDPSNGDLIDTVMLTRFDSPASYTGEAMVEISCHGGVVVTHEILAVLLREGARQADPGEFTQRAVLNGKMDLLQAEAISDLIEAATRSHRQVATSHLDGGLTRRISGLREGLLDLEALLAYDVDFPEEDDGPVARDRIDETAKRVQASIEGLIATAPLGEVIRSGAVVVIAGAPNAGKSSLFNALLGVQRAIVTEIPGTTRDALEALVERSPWPIRLVDTAGLRATGDRLEQLGIEVSERHLRAAHLVLACATSPEEMRETCAAVRGHATAPIVEVYTKRDLPSAPDIPDGAMAVSAQTRSGLEAMLLAVDDILASSLGELPVDGTIITRERQRAALQQAAAEVASFRHAWGDQQFPATISAVHIRSAVTALDELIGSIDVEDVLSRVFQSFCVGK